MKKTIFVCFILMCLISTGCSIQNKDEYTARVYAYSDSVSSAKHIIEYEFVDEKYENADISKEVTVKVKDKLIKGKYLKTEYFDFNYYPTYEYVDDNGNLFCIDPEGKLTYYFWGNPEETGIELSKEECISVVDEFVSDIIDVSKYQLKVDVKENKYEVTYTKFVDNTETTESICVVVLFTGNLYSYSSFMLGKIPEDATNDFDMDKVKESVTNRLDIMFEDAKHRYDEVKYTEVATQYTILKDGQEALICTVDVECINNFETSYMSIGERVGIVISAN